MQGRAMKLHRIIDRLWTNVRALRRDQAANVMLTFGLLLVPIMGAAGAAVDYSRANSTRTAMQAALDAAALSLGKELEAGNVPALKQRQTNISARGSTGPRGATSGSTRSTRRARRSSR